jgi:peptide/nickel transport system permease protein
VGGGTRIRSPPLATFERTHFPEIGRVYGEAGASLPGRVLRGLDHLRRKPLGAFGAVVIAVLILVGITVDVVAPYRYDAIDIPSRLNAPSAVHFFGTDQQGRDIFSRVLFGTRSSVFTGFGAVIFAAILATTIGIVSGYYGGVLDLVFQRIIEIWQSFPGLIFVLFIVAIFRPSTLVLIVAVGLLFTAGTSRIVRGATLSVRQQTYIDAARALGVPDRRILLRHVLPNLLPVIIVSASVQVGAVILLESSLSFLGFGSPPPFPSWGRMLFDAQSEMQFNPYLAIFPGAAIAVTVYSFNMLGDALRDILDPRLRGVR